jgi:hypothetical protein
MIIIHRDSDNIFYNIKRKKSTGGKEQRARNKGQRTKSKKHRTKLKIPLLLVLCSLLLIIRRENMSSTKAKNE